MNTQTTTEFAPILVADIGGTNARFALITDFNAQTNQFVIEHNLTFPSVRGVVDQNNSTSFRCHSLTGTMNTLFEY